MDLPDHDDRFRSRGLPDRPAVVTGCRAGDSALGAMERLRDRAAARGERPAANAASCARRPMRSLKSSGSGGPTGRSTWRACSTRKAGSTKPRRRSGRAAAAGAPPWTVGWLSGLVNKENGHLDEAIANFERVLAAASPEMQARGFDFSRDYEVINELGQTLFERAKLERQPAQAGARTALLQRAAAAFERTLAGGQREHRCALRARPDLRPARRPRTGGESR